MVLNQSEERLKRKVPIDANLFCDWPECEFATNNHNALRKPPIHTLGEEVCLQSTRM